MISFANLSFKIQLSFIYLISKFILMFFPCCSFYKCRI